MYDLIIQLGFTLSLGVVIYLLAIAVPRVSDELPQEEGSVRRRIAIILHILDTNLHLYEGRALRRIRVLTMKLDNFLTRRLNNGREKL